MRTRPELSYANVVASIALFVSLGGGAYAAATLSKDQVKARHIAKNAVGASEITRGAVGRSELKAGAVDSAKVADGTLGVQDFAAGQLPRGPEGPPGADGGTGPPGPPNPNAETLDGIDSKGFVQGGGAAYFDRAELARGASRPLFEIAGIGTVIASCGSGGVAETIIDFEDSAGYRGVFQPDESPDAFDFAVSPGTPLNFTTGDNSYVHVMGGTGTAPGARRGFDISFIQNASLTGGTPCRFQAHATGGSR